MKTIGESKAVAPYSIENLPPVFVGGSVFNYQYCSNPQALPVKDVVAQAFALGLNAIDTSPYYGPSEELLGKALAEINFPREDYYICTKAGRVKLDDFDYSRESVRKSVERSLDRLGTSYLDLVYMHDIEFVEEGLIYEALRELKLLKLEGKIRNIGVSGYPVKFLYRICLGCVTNDIGPLDAILSYSNGCIQNTKLFEYYDKFVNECKIKKVSNGSILSMSLLRVQQTHSFHPADIKLKQKVKEIGQLLQTKYNVDLADLATRFAIKKWLFDTTPQSDTNNLVWNKKTSIVLGVSNVKELEIGVADYNQVKSNEHNINVDDESLFKLVETELEHHLNETWPSGIHTE